MTAVAPSPPASDPPVVIRANGVSKTYGIWSSPKARLAHPLLNNLRRMFPGYRPIEARFTHLMQNMYREFHALQDVSFEIRKGESWGFVGVNGSGKSTLLKIISGNLLPSGGSVEVDGKVAILDYGSGINGEFTGRENVYLKASILGLTRKQVDERFDAIAEFADIGEFMDQPVKTYSSGMQARLGFATMAHVDSDILITDEALAVGDAFFVQKCMRRIRSFLDQGTFLFVSHSTNDVLSLCEKAVWLQNGRINEIGDAKDVCRAYMASIDRRASQAFLKHDEAIAGESGREPSADADSTGVIPPTTNEILTRERRHVRLSADSLAALRNHYAPPRTKPTESRQDVRMLVQETPATIDDLLQRDDGVGGGRIFSVSLLDASGAALASVLGAEEVCLQVVAIAERRIAAPILGFRLNNSRGLTLLADNTYHASMNQPVPLEPGETLAATFRFHMPLLPVGEYVVRAGLADGDEANNALLHVRHEALLVRCLTSGVRHGLVGVPMIEIALARTDALSLLGES